jgi:bifunctional DNA-binding transcriptional regulator/antitoxin component of YhaV-PrlF toxin-antitoxin module
MSSKSIAEKLQIKQGKKVLLVNEPKDYRINLGKLPDNTTVTEKTSKAFDIIQVFISSKAELQNQLPKLKLLLADKGIFWVTYPKGTSKVKADVNRDSIREYGQTVGLQAVSLVAIDDTWSALRLKAV